MPIPTFALALLPGALLLALSLGAQDGLSGLPLGRSELLLGDRLELQVPDSMRNEPRAVDIMSAAPSTAREARLVLDTLGRLVLFAQDLRELGTDDLLADWGQVIDPGGAGAFRIERLPRRRGSDRIRYVKTSRDPGARAIFLQGLLVRLPDDGLVRIDAFVDPAAYRHVEAFDSLVMRIFSSAKAGPGRLDRGPRVDTLHLMSGERVVVRSPRDQVVSTEQGADFLVHRVDRLVPLLSASRPQLILYSGAHPSPFAKELGFGAAQRKEVPGTFLGSEMSWDHYRDTDGALQLMEFVTGEAGGDALRTHIALIGTTDQDMEDLLRIAGSIAPTP